MNEDGEKSLANARSALLDGIEALSAHRDALVLVGAQSVYYWTDDVDLGLAPFTLDADLLLNVELLATHPRIEIAMEKTGFKREGQPGMWLSPRGVYVDLLVAEAQSGQGGERGARVEGHHKYAARKTVGVEAALVDADPVTILALDPHDGRSFDIAVAGPGALLIAKIHKIIDRMGDGGARVERIGKDCTDVLRLLRAREEHALGQRVARAMKHPVSEQTTRVGVEQLKNLFGNRTGDGCRILEESAPDPAVGAEWAASAVVLVNELGI